MSWFSSLFFILVLSVVTFNADAQALKRSFLVQQDDARGALKSGQTVPFKVISANLKKLYGGELIDAALYENEYDGYEYEVIWMAEGGRRLNIKVDALTGKILKTSGGK